MPFYDVFGDELYYIRRNCDCIDVDIFQAKLLCNCLCQIVLIDKALVE